MAHLKYSKVSAVAGNISKPDELGITPRFAATLLGGV
jgi:hypothetical protein